MNGYIEILAEYFDLIVTPSYLTVEWDYDRNRVNVYGGKSNQEEEVICHLDKNSVFQFHYVDGKEDIETSSAEESGVPDDHQIVHLFLRTLDLKIEDHQEELNNPFWAELLANVKKSLPVYEVMFR